MLCVFAHHIFPSLPHPYHREAGVGYFYKKKKKLKESFEKRGRIRDIEHTDSYTVLDSVPHFGAIQCPQSQHPHNQDNIPYMVLPIIDFKQPSSIPIRIIIFFQQKKTFIWNI